MRKPCRCSASKAPWPKKNPAREARGIGRRSCPFLRELERVCNSFVGQPFQADQAGPNSMKLRQSDASAWKGRPTIALQSRTGAGLQRNRDCRRKTIAQANSVPICASFSGVPATLLQSFDIANRDKTGTGGVSDLHSNLHINYVCQARTGAESDPIVLIVRRPAAVHCPDKIPMKLAGAADRTTSCYAAGMATACPNCLALEQRVAKLEAALQLRDAEIDKLRGLLEESQRSGKRQARPFPKGSPKSIPEGPPQGRCQAWQARPSLAARSRRRNL